mmetsp:Transcript_42676/g.62728  ORF Transcript_42676/g.62728 Transcript_42676/m.62728 type:complete len:95 (-) Transcript_42676:595-879(-)
MKTTIVYQEEVPLAYSVLVVVETMMDMPEYGGRSKKRRQNHCIEASRRRVQVSIPRKSTRETKRGTKERRHHNRTFIWGINGGLEVWSKWETIA